ncbi:hypothetical protein PCC7424_0270 [Gloeothece citriformis PCC 7424]|uniref:PEP-CTERM protein-sorting domain-containing protein n=1 Tax=Gloeothece citriformis (strain PCC 7424) TaxID=65393 RepID=B7KAR6_GLOC7|nr:PEP-CTERM sorting domain-containing protein [Gloeothece citriformis]ACK68738.1 hypothetical protein PCC7424_0270 [Gloeothece citriformis PCC 7424]
MMKKLNLPLVTVVTGFNFALSMMVAEEATAINLRATFVGPNRWEYRLDPPYNPLEVVTGPSFGFFDPSIKVGDRLVIDGINVTAIGVSGDAAVSKGRWTPLEEFLPIPVWETQQDGYLSNILFSREFGTFSIESPNPNGLVEWGYIRGGQIIARGLVEGPVVVPEPITLLGTATALGFSVLFKRELKNKQKKAK